MSFTDTVILSCGLAVDAFAVAVTDGVSDCKMNFFKAMFISLVFGIFQGVMPSMSYMAGSYFLSFLTDYGNIVICIVLCAIGIKMLIDRNNSDNSEEKITYGLIMVQGMASSIDALAVGVGFSASEVDIVKSCAIISLVTFLFCTTGVFIGKKFGDILNGKTQLIGGLMLIIIGLKSLIIN